MITLKITLLFAIDLNNEGKLSPRKANKGRDSKRSTPGSKKKRSKSSKKSNKSSRNSKSSGKSSPSGKSSSYASSEVPEHVIAVDKPIGFYHVEYQLIPKQFKYKFDVVCWGPVVKVTTADGSRFFETLIQDNLIWVSVPLEHFLSPLTLHELGELLKHIITFTISPGKKRGNKSGGLDKLKRFHLKKDEISYGGFPEVFVDDPNVDPLKSVQELECQTLIGEVHKILSECIDRPLGIGGKREVVTSLPCSSNEVHMATRSKIIDKIKNGQKVRSRVHDGGTSDERAKSSKKKSNKKEIANLSLQVPAQTLFTDPTLSIYRVLKPSPNFAHAFAFITCQNLLNVKQKLELSPLVLKIHTLNNLPVEILKENGYGHTLLKVEGQGVVLSGAVRDAKVGPCHVLFSKSPIDSLMISSFMSIFVTCDVPKFFTFKSKEIPLIDNENKVEINEASFYPTNSLLHLRIMEVLQTQKIIFEINGIRLTGGHPNDGKRPKKKSTRRNKGGKKKSSKKSSSKKSSTHKTSKKSKRSSKSSSKSSKQSSNKSFANDGDREIIVLAAVSYDFSDLAKGTWSLKEKGQCHNPNILLCQKRVEKLEMTMLQERLTVNELNLIRDGQRSNKSPLTEDVLLLKSTNLKIEAHCLPPQYATNHLPCTMQPYKRLLLIIFNEEIAKFLINEVLLHNQQISNHDVIVLNVIVKFDAKSGVNQIPPDFESLLSGFLLDCGDHCLMFVEGQSDGYILKLIYKVADFNVKNCKVFYNSDHQFEDRLYPNFITIGGFYSITLDIPFPDLFSRQKLYVEGNAPCLAWRAFKKFNLLYNSSSFKSILHYEILPTESELFSFALEFCVHLRYNALPLNHCEDDVDADGKSRTVSVAFNASTHSHM